MKDERHLTLLRTNVAAVKRGFLYALVGSVAVSALLAIGAIVSGDFSSWEIRSLLSAATIGAASICGLGCGAYLASAGHRALPLMGITLAIAAAAALLLSLLTPELLSAVGQLVVESGHKVAKKKPGEPLRGRCDSFVVETDVHYPTDVSLLWDAMRCLLRETGRASGEHAVGGWRQWRYLTREVRSLFHRVRSTRRAKRHPERVEAYLARCRGLVERAVDTLDALRNPGVDAVTCDSIEGYVAHALRQIDQVERRLVRGETIPHEEKVFSIFEEHTRWVSKGKAGTPVELGVPVALIEDQYQFILHHEILWQGADVDVAVPLVQKAQARYPALRACSFDRGFHSPDNRVGLDALLNLNALPKKGRLSNVDREREEEASFAAARRVHPAIESAINGLEHRGLDRVRHHGVDGFARAVALSVLATNLHRIGLILQKRERKRRRRVA